MVLPFFKYQGTGNDFVMIDQRRKTYLRRDDQKIIEHLCDRRFGIGADGLILLSPPQYSQPHLDFEMIYFNADGRESSMCGNGGRCLVAFAHHLQVFDNQCVFNAIDGLHDAKVRPDGWVELKMIDVKNIEIGKDYFLMNTGSPHFVVFVEDLTDINIYEAGRQIRYSERFHKEGVNVNFVEINKNKKSIEVATYERGVEAETFSCGTGVTAAAMAFALKQNITESNVIVPIQTKGGQLEVRFQKNNDGTFSEVWLCGPAERVFAGKFEVKK
jgi:diaminopimelate epimerase